MCLRSERNRYDHSSVRALQRKWIAGEQFLGTRCKQANSPRYATAAMRKATRAVRENMIDMRESDTRRTAQVELSEECRYLEDLYICFSRDSWSHRIAEVLKVVVGFLVQVKYR